MITNKDIRVENGFLIINGDKFPLDGQSPEAIIAIIEAACDTTPTENSDAPITSGGVYTALGTKQDELTFDPVPTDSSVNPVTSGGIYNKIGDITQTGVTGASVAAQLETLGNEVKIEKVPDSFITLESGISITTNQIYKQGKHIFGWITFSFSAQTPTNLKLGTLNTGYTTNYLIRMQVGFGTEGWKSEYTGYATKGVDNNIYVEGYTSGITTVHMHFDYVV